MTRKPFPPKNLLNMPADVRQSAWAHENNPFIVARALRGVDLLGDFVLWALCRLTWPVNVLFIVFMLLWPWIGSRTNPEGLHWPASFFGAAFGVCVISQRLKVTLLAPRADPGFPLIFGYGAAAEAVRSFTYHATACCAAFGWLASASNTPLVVLLTAGGTLGTVTALFWWYHLAPPSWGWRCPTNEEMREYMTRLEARPDLSRDEDNDYATPVELMQPSLNFEGIFGMADTKSRLLRVAEKCRGTPLRTDEAPPNGILLHGTPGNGKTIFAEALAGELRIPFVKITPGAVASKWKNETPRLLSNCFAFAKRNAPCVLFVDEIDGLIRRRDDSSHIEDIKLVNTLLTEIVDVRRHAVVLVAATNFLEALDPAAIREGRFDFKVEVPPPDAVARTSILRLGAARSLPGSSIDGAALARVAKRWEGFSVSRLVSVAKALPEALEGVPRRIEDEHWLRALRHVQGVRRRVGQSAKSLDDLVLHPSTRRALMAITERMQLAAAVEDLGATLPRGALFFGPPGTGKTVAAQAVAAASGWAFIPSSGPELIADEGRLKKLVEEAGELRPAVVFIDEADDVLRERSFNPRPHLVNTLLVLMDGTDRMPSDVLILAATNYIDQVDSALLRAGRFSEKLEFSVPNAHAVVHVVRRWLDYRRAEMTLDSEAWLAASLEGHSVATVEGVLQYALNLAALRHVKEGRRGPVMLLDPELEAAVKTVRMGETPGHRP